MAVIDETLTARNFELIRDRVAEILADELASQSTKNSDPEMAADVWLERLVPLSQQECPAVNVFMADGKYNRLSQLSQTGEYNVAIDVFTRGAASSAAPEDRGDLISTKRMMRIVGVIQAVFSHYKYRHLGFEKKFIDHVEIAEFRLMEPVKAGDGSNVSKGRVLLKVKAEEHIEPVVPNLISGYDTVVKLFDTIYGYVFSESQPPLPPAPPACDPVMVFNTDKSFEIELQSGQEYEIPDTTFEIYVDGVLEDSFDVPSLIPGTINIDI